MPLGEKVRSSSASGRLESQHVTSILSELAGGLRERSIIPSEPGCHGGRAEDFSAARRVGVSEDDKDEPEWLVREFLQQNRRRHSVTLGDCPREIIQQRHRHSSHSAHSLRHSDFTNCLIDDKISLENLQKLKLEFEELESAGSRCIDVKEFGRIVKKCLGFPNTSTAQIQGLFKKIDYSGQGRISWGQFCTHMLQEYKEKEETARRHKQVAFTLPATITALGHGIPIVNIQSTRHPTINPNSAIKNSKWATDFTLMPEYNKLMIGTGDREIQLYELSTLEPHCQINALETIPLILNYSYIDPDKCCVLYGDMEGCVTIILMSSFRDTLRLWKKLRKIENIPNITIGSAVLSPNVTFIRWQVHHDWVTQVKYFHSFKTVASSSNEESSSLVIGCVLPPTDAEQQLNEIREACYEGKTKKMQLSWTPQLRAPRDQTVFNIYKGVKTFDLCEKRSLLVTGGMDKLIRLWNPHFSGKPTGILKGHSAPLVYLSISSQDNHIFSVSTDRTVKIWHIEDQCCLFTAEPKASGIYGDISACSYSSALKSLYVAADCMAVLPLRLRPRLHSGLTVSHNEAVMCCGFSEEFRQVVSCTDGSEVKVWDFDSGRQVFEFGGTNDVAGVTCMTFDLKGRRLITGGKDRCLKMWNFNNGVCLKTLKRDGESREVCDCIFLEVHRNCYVVSVGRDRRIDIYSDIPEDPHHVQRPQPSWKDDGENGHKADILCVAHCPPSLVATGGCDGEIIVWNVITGCILARFGSPVPAEHQNIEGLESSVPCVIFLKNSTLHQFSSTTALLSSGTKGWINLWSVRGGGKFVSSFRASKFQQKITKLCKTDKDVLLYAADRIGYIYVYSTERIASEHKSPRAENFWRAHTSTVTGLQIVDNDQVVLTSSTDCTVRLWSAQGKFIGTFGQPETWSVRISSSWKHPRVPFEVLIDPLSLPECLNGKTCRSEAVKPEETGAVGRESTGSVTKLSGILTSY